MWIAIAKPAMMLVMGAALGQQTPTPAATSPAASASSAQIGSTAAAPPASTTGSSAGGASASPAPAYDPAMGLYPTNPATPRRSPIYNSGQPIVKDPCGCNPCSNCRGYYCQCLPPFGFDLYCDCWGRRNNRCCPQQRCCR